MKILLADSSRFIFRYIQGILSEYRLEAELISAADGVQAISLTREKNPDIILVDSMLPRFNWQEELSRLVPPGSVPVLLLVEWKDKDTLEKATTLGITDYIYKPIEKSDLLARLRAAMRMREQAAARSRSEEKLKELELVVAAQKEAEQNLQRRERELQTLVRNTPDLIARYDRTARCLFVNPALASELSSPPDHLLGKTLEEAGITEEITTRMRAAFEEVFAGGREKTVYFSHPIGREIKHFHMRIVPEFNDHGSVETVLTITRDITDFKKAQDALYRERDMLARVMETSPAGILVVDRDKSILFANARAEHILGLEKSGRGEGGAANRKADWQRFYFDGRPMPHGECALYRVLETGTTLYDFREAIRRDDGRQVFLSVNCASLHQQEEPAGAIMSVQDISARKQAEDELITALDSLRRSEKELTARNEMIETIMSEIPLGIAVRPMNEYEFVFINKQFEEICGWPGEIIHSIQNFLRHVFTDGAYRKQIAARIREDFESGDPERLTWQDLKITRRDGAERYITGKLIPLPGQNLYIYTIQDTTEQVRAAEKIRALNLELEQRVRERTAQLEAANKELEAFSYSVSHDLRAPLRSIDGFSQALLEDYDRLLDERGRDYLQRIRNASRHMGQLIDDLLKLSRIMRSQMRLEKVDLSGFVAEIIQNLQQAEPARQVETTIAQGIIVTGDARLLKLALENLLENAWKFTSKKERARIEFGLAELPERGLVYFIKDNGAGFDMAYAGKLFNAFQRLHSPADFPGTGIGLATVARIIRRHGGEIWAEGRVEEGAIFYFTLHSSG